MFTRMVPAKLACAFASLHASELVQPIAISNEPLQDRLSRAFTGHLAMLEPHKLPEQIRIQYEEVLQEMTRGMKGHRVRYPPHRE